MPMGRWWLCVVLLGVSAVAVPAQILVVRDDRWAAESRESNFLVASHLETTERWLRRTRLPYARVNASALTPSMAEGTLCVLPANRPDAAVVTALQRARRVVVFAFVGSQQAAWQQAVASGNGQRWRVVTEPFSPDRTDGERAAQLAAWLLDGTPLPSLLQYRLRRDWTNWRDELRRKRVLWLNEILRRRFVDERRKRQALALLHPPVAAVRLTLTDNGSAWWQRLQTLLNEHTRIHRALAISLEPRAGEIRGIWLHTYAPTDWETVMQTLQAANFNCLFFRAGRGGNVVYRSPFLPRDAWAEQADLDELANATQAAQRYGIELHAWRVNFHFGTAPDWLKEQMAKDDRLVRDPDGKQALWLNPADPRNQEHEFRAMTELLAYPVAGVHFDYIRYPEVPHYRFDYSEIARRQFEQATGIVLTDFPRQVLLGPLKLRYDDWQRDNITNLVRRVYVAVKNANPQCAVSAAVWQRHRYYFALIKQDWVRWVREGILDFVCPMDYTANATLFAERVKEQVTEVNGTVPIAPGIGAYLMDDEWQLVEQVKIARDLGADGFVVFSYNIAPLRDFLAALTLGATAQPTFPAYRSPKIAFHLSDGVRHKDLPITYRAGDAVTVTAVVSMGLLPPDKVAKVQLALQWERQDGFAEQVLMERELTADDLRNGAIVRCRAKVPMGTVRLVARGTVERTDGERQPFVRRGPFVQGLAPTEFAHLLRSLLPVRLSSSQRRRPALGVVADGWHAERLVALLRRNGHRAFLVGYLLPNYWQAADVLVIPPLRDLRELTYERALQLRQWVNNGGTVLLLSEACGYHAHANLFPEIAEVVGEQTGKTLMLGRRSIRAPLNVLPLRPIGNSRALWHMDGKAVLVHGNLGKGGVVMLGVRLPVQGNAPEWRLVEPLLTEAVRLTVSRLRVLSRP